MVPFEGTTELPEGAWKSRCFKRGGSTVSAQDDQEGLEQPLKLKTLQRVLNFRFSSISQKRESYLVNVINEEVS